jgi:hypothetical protein
MKEEIKSILRRLEEKVKEKFQPLFVKLQKESPELAEEFLYLQNMGVVVYFLEQAIEHFLDEYEE